MPKVAKTIKITARHEQWLNARDINFSAWVREQIDAEIEQQAGKGANHKCKALILAAGRDTGLYPLTKDRPKAMLEIKGRSILEWQVELLRKAGIKEIAVVRGYKKDAISLPALQYFDNDNFENTGNLTSLMVAKQFLDRDTIVLYGDILFKVEILEKLINDFEGTTLVVDRGWKKRYRESQEGHPLAPELATLTEQGPEIAISSLAPGDEGDKTASEFIGLAKVSARAGELLGEYATTIESAWDEAYLRKASIIKFIQELIRRDEQVQALEIWRTWIEVDTFEDYRHAWAKIDQIVEN
jgi:phosphoenolpyruvate phosphomutase